MDEDRVREICREVLNEELGKVVGEQPQANAVTPVATGLEDWLLQQTTMGLSGMFAQLPAETWTLFGEALRHYIQLYIDRTGVCTIPQQWRAFTLAQSRLKTLEILPLMMPQGWQGLLGLAYALTAGEPSPAHMTRDQEWRHVDPVEGDPSKMPSGRF